MKLGVISTTELCLQLLNRSIPFFNKTDIFLKHREQRFIKIDVHYINKIPKLAMIKLLNVKTGCTNRMKVRLRRNTVLFMKQTIIQPQ